ncbi:Positive regulator of CheA protein activity (CheW) [Chitinispirillum alkaliphilum]|nr:Positive regulator of CheA protein activity (CheW) [Chitinispirillum alkaliphilum]
MTQNSTNAGDMSALAGKYLTFSLAQEGYGIGILKVQEIIGLMNVTHVPRTPDYIRGVINLRGKVIPVVDLRLKFGLEENEDTDKTCIIVVQVENVSGEHVIMGIIVDEVCEVLDIKADQIEPSPSFGASLDTEFIMGMGKAAQKVVMLLDVDKVLSKREVETVAQTSEDY